MWVTEAEMEVGATASSEDGGRGQEPGNAGSPYSWER
jgi:hypothetical protein